MRRQTRQRKEEEEEEEGEEVSPIEPLGWLALNLASSQATSRGRKLSLNSFLATFLVTTFWIARPGTFSLLEHRVVCVARLQSPTRGASPCRYINHLLVVAFYSPLMSLVARNVWCTGWLS